MSRMFPKGTPSSRPLKKHSTYPCTETEGYSAWHLLTIGLYSPQAADSFLTSTLDERPSVVFDHLFEHMTRPIARYWFEWADVQLPHLEVNRAGLYRIMSPPAGREPSCDNFTTNGTCSVASRLGSPSVTQAPLRRGFIAPRYLKRSTVTSFTQISTAYTMPQSGRMTQRR